MPQTQINCPQCRQPFLADIYQLFDVGEQPQLKQIFLSGMFNLAQCPHCDFQGRISTPLVYHDTNKELLLTYFPPEMGLTMDGQQKTIGPLINRLVNNLPQEKRRGYLFNPKTMITLQGMIETILQADGITKEMIRAQEDRLKLVQKLMNSEGESRIQMIQDEDELINGDFFGIFSRLMESAIAQRDENAAKRLGELQNQLLEFSSHGKKLKAEAMEIQEAMQSLRQLGDQLNRENILDLVINTESDTKVRAYARLARPAMDYQFFQLLSERIDRARAKGKERLKNLRENLLRFTKEVDDEIDARTQVARQNLKSLLQTEDIRTALEQNVEAIDEFFAQAVYHELEQAREAGDIERSSKLKQINDFIEEISAPPQEYSFIEDLLDLADDPKALEDAIQFQNEKITPELIQMISSLITQTMTGLDQVDNVEEKAERREIITQLQTVHAAVLRFSMRQRYRA